MAAAIAEMGTNEIILKADGTHNPELSSALERGARHDNTPGNGSAAHPVWEHRTGKSRDKIRFAGFRIRSSKQTSKELTCQVPLTRTTGENSGSEKNSSSVVCVPNEGELMAVSSGTEQTELKNP